MVVLVKVYESTKEKVKVSKCEIEKARLQDCELLGKIFTLSASSVRLVEVYESIKGRNGGH